MAFASMFLSAFIVYLYAAVVVSGSDRVAEENGLRWCENFCLCPRNSNETLKCIQALDIYTIINLTQLQIRRLNHANWDPIVSLKWCDSSDCLCNRESEKLFACIKQPDLLTSYVEEAARSLPEVRQTNDEEEETPALRTAGLGGSFDVAGPETTPNSRDEDSTTHRRRDMDEERRNRRRNNRKNRRNRKRNRNDEELEGEAFSSSESLLPSTDPDSFDQSQDHEYFDYTVEPSNMLPKQEAINSSPMVTAMQPATRRLPITYPTTTTSRPTVAHQGKQSSANPGEREPIRPLVQESAHPDFQQQNSNMAPAEPILEVPVQRKSVAGRVSEDLKQITEDIQHIRNDVVFNQRILLVTVGIAGVAMLGVLILALHACCSKRSSSRRARITENGRHDDNHHLHHPSSTVTKVNIDEAW